MRNLKKVLSLALALVMLLGMMVVGAGATEFKDASDIKNTEAVAVVSGIGVLQGDENGSFNPEGTLSRAEAAVVIAKLDLGAAFGNLATTNASTFKDVGAGYGWAKPYIDYCAARGLIAGDGNGHFMPDQKVSGVQFALMVCRVLGYEDANEQIGGDDWAVEAAALARKAGLTVDVVLADPAAITRDDMAQVAFNALQADMVKYDGKGITIGDVTIPAGNAEARDEGSATVPYNDGDDGKLQLCEEKFPKLRLDTTVKDDNGRTANVWTYGEDNVVASVAQDATHSLSGDFTSKTLYSTIGRTVVNTIGGDRTLNVYLDGVALSGSTSPTLTAFTNFLKGNDTTKASASITAGNGTVTDIYVSDDEVNICVVNTYAGTVSKVTAAKDDDPRTVTVAGMDYETEDFAKSDVVLYTKGYSDVDSAAVITSMSLAERVEGAVTKVTTGTSFVVDGTTYKYSATFGDAKISAIGDAAFYLDNGGYVIKIGELTASKDYAYVLYTKYEAGRYGTHAFYAKLLLTDGTIVETELDVPSTVTNQSQLDTAYLEKIVSYTVDDDKYSLTAKSGVATTSANATVTTGVATISLGGSSVSTNSNTVFLVETDDDTYAAYVGYKNVPNISATGTATVVSYASKANEPAEVVFIGGASVESSSASDVIFIRANKDASVITEKGKEYREFDAIVGGEATKIQVAESALGSSADCEDLVKTANDGKIYAVSSLVTNSKDLVTKYNAYAASTNSNVGYVNGTGTVAPASEVVGLGGASYGWDEDVVVGKWENSAMSVVSIDDIETDTNDTVVVVLDKGATVVGAFITKVTGNPDTVGVTEPSAKTDALGQKTTITANKTTALVGDTVTYTVTLSETATQTSKYDITLAGLEDVTVSNGTPAPSGWKAEKVSDSKVTVYVTSAAAVSNTVTISGKVTGAVSATIGNATQTFHFQDASQATGVGLTATVTADKEWATATETVTYTVEIAEATATSGAKNDTFTVAATGGATSLTVAKDSEGNNIAPVNCSVTGLVIKITDVGTTSGKWTFTVSTPSTDVQPTITYSSEAD